MHHPQAPTGKGTKYARHERERRFLLDEVPSGGVVRTQWIEDRYIDGTRIRLRRSTVDGDAPTYKLTQKVPAPDGGPGLITTMYLDEAEYAAFAAMPAASLTKTRHSVPPYGVDVFEGPLAGLLLAEVEYDDDEAMSSFTPLIPVVAEVTTDVRFSGGRLAATSPTDLARLLVDFGLAPSGSAGGATPQPVRRP